jgi:hypothetical protein
MPANSTTGGDCAAEDAGQPQGSVSSGRATRVVAEFAKDLTSRPVAEVAKLLVPLKYPGQLI